jgi:predicted RNase H-like HicB family nuclease
MALRRWKADGLTLVVEPSDDGGFIAYDDDLRVVAQGETEEEARARFEDARQHLADYLKGGEG